MPLSVFFAVLFAALLHAGWNALVKGASNRLVTLTAVVVGHVPLALVSVLIVPLPEAASVPYMIASVLLHTGYQVFLLIAYRFGDLSHVYPLARGSAPLIVALISVVFLGTELARAEWLGVCFIATGIFSLILVRGHDGLRNRPAAFAALITGVFIAGYSLVDGLGGRIAGTGVGFYSVATIANSLVFVCIVRVYRPGTLTQVFGPGRNAFWFGGSASFIAYAIVVWGFTQAPIALVTALRETSIVFAVIIGAVVFNEQLNWRKFGSIVLTLTGAIVLRISRNG